MHSFCLYTVTEWLFIVFFTILRHRDTIPLWLKYIIINKNNRVIFYDLLWLHVVTELLFTVFLNVWHHKVTFYRIFEFMASWIYSLRSCWLYVFKELFLIAFLIERHHKFTFYNHFYFMTLHSHLFLSFRLCDDTLLD